MKRDADENGGLAVREDEALTGVLEPPFSSRRAVVEEAVETVAAEYRHGDKITRARLCALFGIVYPRVGTPTEINTLNSTFAGMKEDLDAALLREHKMALKSIGGKQWLIVPPNEQSEHALKVATKKMREGLGKARAIVENTLTDGLTDAEQRRLSDAQGRIATLQMFAGKTLRKAPALGSGKDK